MFDIVASLEPGIVLVKQTDKTLDKHTLLKYATSPQTKSFPESSVWVEVLGAKKLGPSN